MFQEAERVEVFDFTACTELSLTFWTYRNVGIDAERAFRHIAVANIQPSYQTMQCFSVCYGFGCGTHFRLGDNFQQRRTGTVQVNTSSTVQTFMYGFTRIFFHVRTGNIDGFNFIAYYDFQLAVFNNRQIQLADLIAFRQIRIKIVFTVEHVFLIDFRIQSQTEFDGFFDDFAVHYRQYARQRTLNHAGMGIRLGTECSGCAAEDFGLGVELDVDFQSDYGFPSHKGLSVEKKLIG